MAFMKIHFYRIEITDSPDTMSDILDRIHQMSLKEREEDINGKTVFLETCCKKKKFLRNGFYTTPRSEWTGLFQAGRSYERFRLGRRRWIRGANGRGMLVVGFGFGSRVDAAAWSYGDIWRYFIRIRRHVVGSSDEPRHTSDEKNPQDSVYSHFTRIHGLGLSLWCYVVASEHRRDVSRLKVAGASGGLGCCLDILHHLLMAPGESHAARLQRPGKFTKRFLIFRIIKSLFFPERNTLSQ